MSSKHIVFYFFYLVIAFFVIAVLRFPGEQIGRRVSDAIPGIFPSMGMEADRVAIDFPLGIEFQESILSYNNEIFIPMERLSIGFSIWELLTRNRSIYFSATFFDGELTGEIQKYFPENNTATTLEMNLAGIKLEKITHGLPFGMMEISMEVAGHYTQAQSGAQKKGEGHLALSNMRVAMEGLVFNILGIDGLTFSRVDIDFSKAGKSIDITKCIALGDVLGLELMGSLDPMITSGGSLDDLILNLSGFLQPQPEYFSKFASLPSISNLFKGGQEKGVPIRITGPLSAPEVEFE